MHLKANTSIFWQVVRHFIDKLWAWVEVRDHLGATCDPCFVQFSRKGHVTKAYLGEAVPVHDQAEGREMAPVSLYSLFLAMEHVEMFSGSAHIMKIIKGWDDYSKQFCLCFWRLGCWNCFPPAAKLRIPTSSLIVSLLNSAFLQEHTPKLKCAMAVIALAVERSDFRISVVDNQVLAAPYLLICVDY